MLHNITEKTLGNGLKVICLKKNGAPTVSVQVWYKTGSVNETSGVKGISHFLEHMMFRGSAKVKPEEHSKRINDTGGHCNAFTAEDITAYVNSVPRDYLDMVLELEADRMANLLIDQTILDTERKVIMEEYQTYMNNPVAKAFLEFRTEFYGTYPYATSPLGLIEDLKGITIDKCMNYYRNWYRPDNAVVVVVGNIDSEQDVFDRVESHFGSFIRPEIAIPKRPEPFEQKLIKAHRMHRRVDFDVPLLILGYPGPSSSSADAISLEILQIVLSGGESSRLHREVVRKQSVAVMASGMNHLLKYSGMSMFFAAFTPDNSVKKVEKALDQQISIIKSEGITKEEMEKVKNSTLTNRTFELYSADNISQRIGYSEAIEGDYRLWVERLEALKKLDVDTLVDVARRYWDDSMKHVLYLHPRKVNPMLYVAGFFRRLVRRR